LSDFVRCHAFAAVHPHISPCAPSSSGLPAKASLAKSLTVDHCFVKMSRVSHARLLLLENASIGLSTDHIHTLHLQLEISMSVSTITDGYSAPLSLRFHLSKLSDERVRKDICDAFDAGVKSRGLLCGAIVDPSSLDRRLVSLVQSICRRFLGQRKWSGLTSGTRREIPVDHQDPAIGIHIRIIWALLPSSYPAVLCRLFNLCLSTESSLSAWNSTEVHMVAKDVNRIRDADNVRPITLICMHRKLFERLLLVHCFDRTGWAKLHPTPSS
jgi:hypothetical protein